MPGLPKITFSREKSLKRCEISQEAKISNWNSARDFYGSNFFLVSSFVGMKEGHGQVPRCLFTFG